jgi:tetratricopeptide (TPR) repeat protein
VASRPLSRRVAALAGVFSVCAGLVSGACAARQAPAVAPAPPTARALALPTIESTDTRLGSALAAAKAQPTSRTLAAVAAEYQRLGVFDRAIAYMDRAVALSPGQAPLLAARARVWRDSGQPGIALGDAHRALYFAPASADALNTLGTIQFALGALDDAAATFSRALTIAPGAAWALNNLCYVALIKGDAATALTRCEAAVGQNPDSPTARNNLALVHASAGRLTEARSVFLAGSDRLAGLYNLGIVHLARRDYDAAIEALGEACREAPKFEAACERVTEARRLAGREKGRQP